MRRSPRVALSVAGFVLLVASSGQAQHAGPHRWAMQVATDVGTILDFYGESCSKTTAPAAGGGISILRRLPHRLVAIVDTRADGVLDVFGCKTTAAPPRLIGPNEYEHGAVNVYPHGAPKKPFARTALRLGIETPPNRAMGRITMGGGMFWTGARTPFATLGLDFSTGGDGARFTAGLETSRAWVRTHSTYARFRADSLFNTTPLPSRSESRLAVHGWTQLHVGLELPLRWTSPTA
jgi:hypothetical protein